MTQWEAALVVLYESRVKSLHFREIATRIIAAGYCTFKTDTPSQSVRVAMTDRCPHGQLFNLIGDGEYEIGDLKKAESLLRRIKDVYQLPQIFSLRDEIEKVREREEKNGAFDNSPVTQGDSFDPQSVTDARERALASIVRRQGQITFRNSLLSVYNGKCAITGCGLEFVLDAAHIISYKGPATNHTGNGLLLRTDLHTLFDLGFIAVDTETMTLLISEELAGTCYEEYRGKSIRIPSDPAMCPDRRALDQHRRATGLAKR